MKIGGANDAKGRGIQLPAPGLNRSPSSKKREKEEKKDYWSDIVKSNSSL
jgi:hypothetical protein